MNGEKSRWFGVERVIGKVAICLHFIYVMGMVEELERA